MDRFKVPKKKDILAGQPCLLQDTCLSKECPSTPEEFNDYTKQNPLPTPEQACLISLSEHISVKSRNEFLKRSREINALLERSLAMSAHDKVAATNEFRKILELLTELDNLPAETIDAIKSSGNYKSHFKMAEIRAFSKAYLDRISGKKINPDHAQVAHDEICEQIARFSNHYKRRGQSKAREARSFRAEYKILCMFNRDHIQDASDFGFMANDREEASNAQTFNHDISIMRHTDKGYTSKVPVQVKYDLGRNRREYDESILMVGYTDLQRVIQSEYSQIKQHIPAGPYMKDRAPSIPSLLITEKRLGTSNIDPIALRLLDAGTSYLNTLVYTHAAKHNQ